MNKQFVLRRTATSGTKFFCKNHTTSPASAIWTDMQSAATLHTSEEAEVWNRCFKGLGYEMVEYASCADGHDFSEVELDQWSASGVHGSELDVGLVITCGVCRQTAYATATADVRPRDWTVSE
jgi:hypothetical protein